MPARTAPAPKRQMSRPTLLAARALNWVHRLWNTVSTILAAMAWMVSLIPAWVPLCAYPNMQDVGMIAGISTGLLTSVAAVYFPTLAHHRLGLARQHSLRRRHPACYLARDD